MGNDKILTGKQKNPSKHAMFSGPDNSNKLKRFPISSRTTASRTKISFLDGWFFFFAAQKILNTHKKDYLFNYFNDFQLIFLSIFFFFLKSFRLVPWRHLSVVLDNTGIPVPFKVWQVPPRTYFSDQLDTSSGLLLRLAFISN